MNNKNTLHIVSKKILSLNNILSDFKHASTLLIFFIKTLKALQLHNKDLLQEIQYVRETVMN